MFRKTAAFLLMLCLFAGCVRSYADPIDLSYVREHSSTMSLEVDSEEDIAFVDSELTVKDRSFIHKYESDNRYSATEFDVLLIDYSRSSIRAVPRLWIYYSADEYLYVNSVTFNVGGKAYTFTDIASPDRRRKDDKGAMEDLLIKFGFDNCDFLIALEEFIKPYNTLDLLKDAKITMTLHGTEDVTVELGFGFLLDFAVVIKGAYININGFDTILEVVNPTPMQVNEII